MRFLYYITLLLHYRLDAEAVPLQISNGNNRTVDEPVLELENLKSSDEKPSQLSFSASGSSFFSDVNGRLQGHSEARKQLDKNGDLVAKITQKTDLAQDESGKPHSWTETKLNVPSKGIHKSSKQIEQADAAIAKFNEISGTQYSPLDMAEYVFWTGDEKGVTLAIEDFLQEGFMTREQAIHFLQSIKTNLDYIKAHYQGLQRMEEKIAGKLQQQMKIEEDKKEIEKNIRSSLIEVMKTKEGAENEDNENSEANANYEKRRKEREEDYDEMQNRGKGDDELYSEFSLEEIIYQLAKLMFSQSLTQGSAHAHQALRRFTEYLEKEVEYGQISPQLEKKILGVLVTALSNTLQEHPDLLSAASNGLSNMNNDAFVKDQRNHLISRHSQDLPAVHLKGIKKFGPIVTEMRDHIAVRRNVPLQQKKNSFNMIHRN